MQPLSRSLRLAAAILLSHIVSACGSGGGDDGVATNRPTFSAASAPTMTPQPRVTSSDDDVHYAP